MRVCISVCDLKYTVQKSSAVPTSCRGCPILHQTIGCPILHQTMARAIAARGLGGGVGGVYPRGPPGVWPIRGAGLSGWAASASAAGEEWVGHVTGRGWVGGAKDQGDEQTASQERAMATCVGPSLGMPVVRPLIFSNSSKKTIVSRPCLARSHSINLPFDE